ncbi:MAG: DUF4339 domain-containing protein, partial [Verrucomicrobiota bacterium]|nr:DUF4339 domain-containing protein [Verrucomicrobiota bacterium]
MDFYVYLNGARRGPFRREQIDAYLADGLLHSVDLAAAQAGSEWKPLASFAETQAAGPAEAVPPGPIAATDEPVVAPPVDLPGIA